MTQDNSKERIGTAYIEVDFKVKPTGDLITDMREISEAVIESLKRGAFSFKGFNFND